MIYLFSKKINAVFVENQLKCEQYGSIFVWVLGKVKMGDNCPNLTVVKTVSNDGAEYIF